MSRRVRLSLRSKDAIMARRRLAMEMEASRILSDSAASGAASSGSSSESLPSGIDRPVSINHYLQSKNLSGGKGREKL